MRRKPFLFFGSRSSGLLGSAPGPGLRRLDGAAGTQAGGVPDRAQGTAAAGVRRAFACRRRARAEAVRLCRTRGDAVRSVFLSELETNASLRRPIPQLLLPEELHKKESQKKS